MGPRSLGRPGRRGEALTREGGPGPAPFGEHVARRARQRRVAPCAPSKAQTLGTPRRHLEHGAVARRRRAPHEAAKGDTARRRRRHGVRADTWTMHSGSTLTLPDHETSLERTLEAQRELERFVRGSRRWSESLARLRNEHQRLRNRDRDSVLKAAYATARARAGDRLCGTKLDRLGRSLREQLETVDNLKARGIHLVSLEERLDTSSTAGDLVFHLFGAIAHFKRRLISERTCDGIAVARRPGRTPGRQPLDQETILATQRRSLSKPACRPAGRQDSSALAGQRPTESPPGYWRGCDLQRPLSCAVISSARESQRRARARSVCLADSNVDSTEARRRRRAQRSMRALSAKGSRCSRSSAGALTTICFKVMMALVRAFTAVRGSGTGHPALQIAEPERHWRE